MSSLEKLRIESCLAKISASKLDLRYRAAKLESEIERIRENIDLQEVEEDRLRKQIKDLKE